MSSKEHGIKAINQEFNFVNEMNAMLSAGGRSGGCWQAFAPSTRATIAVKLVLVNVAVFILYSSSFNCVASRSSSVS